MVANSFISKRAEVVEVATNMSFTSFIQHTIEKVTQLGGKALTASDSSGYIYDPDGIDLDKLDFIMELKNIKRGRIHEYAEKYGCEFHEGERPWGVPCDIAFPSATQNEISADDAKTLVKNGVIAVGEGANMPTILGGVHVFQEAKIMYAPSKAANAGGVTVSGLEQSQNALRLSWTEAEVDTKLQAIMKEIHSKCVWYGGGDNEHVDYVKGANLAGFVRVADAMLAYGVV